MAKSDWEVVKDTSKKAAKVSPQAVKTVKSTPKIAAKPVAKVEVSKQNGKSKDQKKKVVKKSVPFELGENALARLGGSVTGTAAAIQALNLLTAEFSAPEKIPPYEKEGTNFPSSKLDEKVRNKILEILKNLSDDQRSQFGIVLLNNLLSSTRKADGAWGARAMGQLLIRYYPKMGVLTDDILGTETHPGAVLSVIWLYSQAKTAEALMSVLFWLVLPRLKQKKVADYLPKILSDIEAVLKTTQSKFTPSQVSAVILALSDTKNSKQTQARLSDFFKKIQSHISPDHTWINPLLSHLTGSRQIHALPIIIQAIEKDTNKATSVLKELSNENRIQVEYILEAVPIKVLNQKARTAIQNTLEEPMASSVQIKRKIETKKAAVAQKACATESSFCIFGILKYMIYATILIGASSKFESTRPYYTAYAEPVYNTYLKETVDGVIIPKYDQFVKPQIDLYVIPTYTQHVKPNYVKFLKPHVDQGVNVIKPKLIEMHIKAWEAYKVHLEPRVKTFVKQAGPTMNKLSKDVKKMMKTVQLKSVAATEGWGTTVDASIKLGRSTLNGHVATAREMISNSLGSAQKFVILQKEGIENQVANFDLKTKVLDGADFARVKLEDGYAFIMVASADQRALVTEKLGFVAVIAGEKLGEFNELLIKYEVNTYAGRIFEGVGRSVIWIGDLIGELSEMRWCCATNRFIKLKDQVVEISNEMYLKLRK